MNRFYFFLSLLTLTATPKLVFAHGASIEYREEAAITIQAKYDDGKPMANAQVVIYAPSDRAAPWLKGTTDENGHFTFIPDAQPENQGDWDVKVRQSGHGDITTISLKNGHLDQVALAKASSGTASYTPSQKLIMAAAVGFGFVGTGLFFARPKS